MESDPFGYFGFLMSKENLPKNVFFDINKLPGEKGLLLFGLSMNKLQNRQDAEGLSS